MHNINALMRNPPPTRFLPTHALRSAPSALASLLLTGLLAPSAAMAVDRYEGSAYAKRDGELLYRETHFRYQDQGKPARLVLYTCADGTLFARKRVWTGAQPSAPDFEFIDARDGYREGVRRAGGGREVYVQANAKAAVQAQPIDAPANAVIDAGFDAFVRTQWAALAKGDKVTAKFLLPSRQAFLGVGIRKSDITPRTAQAADQLRLRMNLDAWYGFAVPQTTLTYLSRDRWLLRFEGIGTIRDRKGRNQEVRIEFPPRLLVTSAPRAELDAALAAPLQQQCRG